MINPLLIKAVMFLVKKLAKRSDNTVDDRLVSALDLAFGNNDYGLQRKPTGPRANKRTPNGKAKKA